MAPNEIDLTACTRSARAKLTIGLVLAALMAAGGLASFFAGPEEPAVRIVAGAISPLILLAFAFIWVIRNRRPARLVVDHEGIRLLTRRKRPLVRLAWTELAGVGVMTNQVALARERLGESLEVGPRMASVSIWLELYPADAAAVARHPELKVAWAVGGGTAPGEQQRWRGDRSGSVLFGGHKAQPDSFAN